MNYYAVVFLLRPQICYPSDPFSERENVCDSQENGVRTRGVAIVNHRAIAKILRVVNLLPRSIFSTAGSCGQWRPLCGRCDLRCKPCAAKLKSHLNLKFPNAVVLNAVGRRNTQMRAKERKWAQKERKRKSADERNSAQKGAKERKRAQKGAKERSCAKLQTTRFENNQVWELPMKSDSKKTPDGTRDPKETPAGPPGPLLSHLFVTSPRVVGTSGRTCTSA